MTEGSLVFIVITATLLFGSVESWSMALVGIMTAIAFIVFLWRFRPGDGALSTSRGVLLSMSLLVLFPLLQMVPLPVSMISMVHTKLSGLFTITHDVTPAFHSISVYPFATEIALSQLIVYLMVFSIAAFGIKSRTGISKIIKTIAVFGFLLSLFGIIQKATWNGKLFWFRELAQGGSPFGPFVNRNHFAGFIGMIIPLSLGISLRSSSMEKKILYAFLTVVMAIALFFSLSRGGMTSFVGGILAFSFAVFAQKKSKKKLVPVFLFVLVLGVYLLYLGITPVVDRFTQTEVSNEQRFAAWRGVVSALKDYPIFGSGLGTFQYIFKIYQPDGLYLYWDHAHNDYLELLLEGGIVGAIVIALFIFSVVKRIVISEATGREIYLKAGILSSLTTIAIHSVFDFNLQIPSNAILFFLVLGMGLTLSYKREEGKVEV